MIPAPRYPTDLIWMKAHTEGFRGCSYFCAFGGDRARAAKARLNGK